MDKFTDWKQYVQKETDKARKEGRIREDSQPPRQVPSYDPDRFKIRRSKEMTEKTAEPPVAKETGRQSDDKKDIEQGDAGGQGSLTSPFVSVQQVWDAAERTNRSRKSVKKDETSLRQRKLPGINRVTAEPGGTIYTQKGKPSHEETREELLERLVNPTITLDEASKIMGVCKATVRRYTAKGILPHYRTPGNQRRFKLNDIINFLEEQRR